jgi:tetratricopeptide (TPR) repeat protein
VAARDGATRQQGANAGVFLATFALILLAMAALFVVDLFLAGQERAERRSEARHFYIEGIRAAHAGKRSQAVDRFQSALSAERSNPLYQRSVAEAMLAEGKVAEARAEAAARLQQEPTDAAASLVVARALVREGSWREAVSYYHRAIYGQWDQNAAGNRMTSRFELIELLAKLGAQRELLAELLPLQDEAPADLMTRRRIAHLFLDAGAPSRAIEIYRDLLRRHKGDAESYAGLGEAELARGNYRSAQDDFAQAARLAPADSSISHRLALAQRVIGLDPTRRGLSGEERHRRSIELLRLTLQATESCLGADSTRMNRAVLDSARAALTPRGRMPITDRSTVDRNLDLAERLWDLRRERCPALPTEGESAVALVLERVEQ